MTRILLMMFLFALICLACSLTPSGGINIKHNGTEKSFEAVSAYVVPNSSGGHSIQITNYPVQLKGTYDYSAIKAKENGQYRIDVAIFKQKASGKQPIVPGEYVDQDPREEPQNKIVRATIFHYDNGKEVSNELDYKKLRGLVKITSVEGETVKGTIDVKDDSSSIKGSFSAVPLS